MYTKFGHERTQNRDLKIKYAKVHAHTNYNILLSHPSLNALGAIVSTPHLAMKLPLNIESIIIAHANQKTFRKCYMASLRLNTLAKDEPCQDVHYIEIVIGIKGS